VLESKFIFGILNNKGKLNPSSIIAKKIIAPSTMTPDPAKEADKKQHETTERTTINAMQHDLIDVPILNGSDLSSSKTLPFSWKNTSDLFLPYTSHVLEKEIWLRVHKTGTISVLASIMA